MQECSFGDYLQNNKHCVCLGQLEGIALSPDAQDGIGYLGSLQANNLTFTQTQAQASQAPGGSQVLPHSE